MQRGFTLIELSIVLVIIGLIVGGILVGRDLISASEARAQIAQIEKYNSAVNAFRNKYGGIPGDLNLILVNQFGFAAGAGCLGGFGQRDGNGLIDGYPGQPLLQGSGETAAFWGDLSGAGNLIEGQFPNNGGAAFNCTAANASVMSTAADTTYVGNYLPAAKIGYGNFVYVYEISGYNWYGVSAVTSNRNTGGMGSLANIAVFQAYNIDKKIDDGLPTTGTVQANYISGNFTIAIQNANAQTTDSATSCYNTTNKTYSLGSSANGGSGLNCALSFRFQ